MHRPLVTPTAPDNFRRHLAHQNATPTEYALPQPACPSHHCVTPPSAPAPPRLRASDSASALCSPIVNKHHRPSFKFSKQSFPNNCVHITHPCAPACVRAATPVPSLAAALTPHPSRPVPTLLMCSLMPICLHPPLASACSLDAWNICKETNTQRGSTPCYSLTQTQHPPLCDAHVAHPAPQHTYVLHPATPTARTLYHRYVLLLLPELPLVTMSARKDVRMWFGLSAVAEALRMLVEAFPSCGLSVSITTHETLYQKGVFAVSHLPAFAPSSLSAVSISSLRHSSLSSHRSGSKRGEDSKRWGDCPLVLFLEIRLGLDAYTFPWPIGITQWIYGLAIGVSSVDDEVSIACEAVEGGTMLRAL
ncbi:hypothetical protein DFH08DRAFT_813912 [Mycena albidolilacea]|uniref:Cysteine protease n=1 Tax=Mycena albidolilacea TaxID=1033008 RepID=A0AAD6ZR82_9AGAR|nr:hypothetical protein DFH08DRAFT_813912 [Mycena albidolilacea]